MSRDIKFRVWCKDTKTMGTNWNSLHVLLALNGGEDKSNKILMQFSGLRDRNGDDIYEGDIVSSELNCMISAGRVNHTVEFIHDQFCVNGSGLLSNVNHFDTKVVGNIHQNPELIDIDK